MPRTRNGQSGRDEGDAAVAFMFRKSKKVGPMRVTVSKRGVSTSVGNGFFRLTQSSTGRQTRTTRIPGTGVSWRKSSTRSRRR